MGAGCMGERWGRRWGPLETRIGLSAVDSSGVVRGLLTVSACTGVWANRGNCALVCGL